MVKPILSVYSNSQEVILFDKVNSLESVRKIFNFSDFRQL